MSPYYFISSFVGSMSSHPSDGLAAHHQRGTLAKIEIIFESTKDSDEKNQGICTK